MNVFGNAILKMRVKIAQKPVKTPVFTVKRMRRLIMRSLFRKPERLRCKRKVSAMAMATSDAAEIALMPCMKLVLGRS